MWYLNTAEDQFTTAPESMHIETMSNAYLCCHGWEIYPGLRVITRMANLMTSKTYKQLANRYEPAREFLLST
jgi:hypothetical protein